MHGQNLGIDQYIPFCNAKPLRQLIASLLYLANTVRPDIDFAVAHLSRVMQRPSENLWISTKLVLR